MTAERRYWLVKSEAGCYSWDDLWNAPRRTTFWDGVRNYQARNMLRDQFRKGDLVFFGGSRKYHVGIYWGKGRILHAPYSGSRVKVERIWTRGWSAGTMRLR